MIIKSPARRYFAALHFQRYFEKKEKIPTMFTRILLNKVDGLDAIERIDYEIRMIQKIDLKGTDYEDKLRRMKKKYTEYIKKYPLP